MTYTSTEEIVRHDLRKAYRLNHSDLRALVRHAGVNRLRELSAVCARRQFWKGDAFSRPANAGAVAALRVLEGSLGCDLLALKSRLFPRADRSARLALVQLHLVTLQARRPS
jgi:hypothetical protein